MSAPNLPARMTLEIPGTHPWMVWLQKYADKCHGMVPMEHGIVTVTIEGVEQRYDLLEVRQRSDAAFTIVTEWRMYDEPGA